MISAEEVERRLRHVSQLRALILEMKFAAREAYRRGELPICPLIDIRSDPEYWIPLYREKGLLPEEDSPDCIDSQKSRPG